MLWDSLSLFLLSRLMGFFKALALWANAFYKSICPVNTKLLNPKLRLKPSSGNTKIAYSLSPEFFFHLYQILCTPEKPLLMKGVKLLCKKKYLFERILPEWAGCFWYCFSLRLTVLFPPLIVKCPNFWRKVMKRRGLRFENFCT